MVRSSLRRLCRRVRLEVLLCYLRVLWSLCSEIHRSTVKYLRFDRELHNVDYSKTKAHKYLKKIETLHVRPISESDQCLDDTAFRRFRELKRERDSKSLHTLIPYCVTWKSTCNY
jgi:hypothetical protein